MPSECTQRHRATESFSRDCPCPIFAGLPGDALCLSGSCVSPCSRQGASRYNRAGGEKMSARPKSDGIVVSPAGGSAGAYVTGLDLSKAYGADEVAELRQALLDHLVVALPDQAISLDD